MIGWHYLVLIALPLLGGAMVWVLPTTKEAHIRTLLTFSGAYLFGITILHLLPVAFVEASTKVGLFILVGFVLQLLLDLLSQGVEHGHMHTHAHTGNKQAMAISIMIGLSVHAFLEGIPLGGMEWASHDGHHHAHTNLSEGGAIVPLLLGIALHKIPAAFALMALLRTAKVSRIGCWVYLLIFAFMSPLAAFLTSWLGAHDAQLIQRYMPYIFGLVIGSFMHISTTILFEVGTPVHTRFNLSRWASILLGLLLAGLTLLA